MSYRIFINPGHHPGIDPGAVNEQYGVTEADTVRRIGELVKKYLIDAGCEVRLLQTDNLYGENPRYANVTREANEWVADLFISVHCNAAAAPAARGTEVFVYSLRSKAARLARCVQDSIVYRLGTVDRGVKEGKGLSVLKLTDMPACLVETAFISNERDIELLMRRYDDFARAIAVGVTDYLQTLSV